MFASSPNNIAQQQCGTSPRELGIIQRVEGIRNGLDEIQSRLAGLTARIANGLDVEKKPLPMPVGIPSNLNICDERIQEIINIVSDLEKAF